MWPILFLLFLVVVLSNRTAFKTPITFIPSCILYLMFWLPIPLPSTVIPRYLNLSTCLTKALSLINTSNFGIYHQVFCFFEADFQSPFFVFFIYMQNWEIHVVILVNMNSMSQESCAKATWSSAKFNLNRWDSRIGKPIGTN